MTTIIVSLNCLGSKKKKINVSRATKATTRIEIDQCIQNIKHREQHDTNRVLRSLKCLRIAYPSPASGRTQRLRTSSWETKWSISARILVVRRFHTEATTCRSQQRNDRGFRWRSLTADPGIRYGLRRCPLQKISIENNVHVENRFGKRVGPEVSGVARGVLGTVTSPPKF